MPRKDFLSDDLVQIRDRLKAYSNSEEKNNAQDAAPTENQNKNHSRSDSGRQFKKAVQKRSEEYLKSRRDLMTRLTENLATLEEEARQYRTYIDESQKLQDFFQQLLTKLEKATDSAIELEDDSAKLGEAFRKVENIRLEFIREQARFAKLTGENEKSAGKDSQAVSLLPEIGSLNIKQLFKLGFFFSMPMALAILAGALIIALVIIISMGGL